MLKQAIRAKNSNWLQICQEDVDKIGMKVSLLYISLDEDKIRIIWKAKDNIWEAVRECNNSLKKLICETIHNPSYRGVSSLDRVCGNIITCSLEDIDLYKEQLIQSQVDDTNKGAIERELR
jgi:hypothetical protein